MESYETSAGIETMGVAAPSEPDADPTSTPLDQEVALATPEPMGTWPEGAPAEPAPLAEAEPLAEPVPLAEAEPAGGVASVEDIEPVAPEDEQTPEQATEPEPEQSPAGLAPTEPAPTEPTPEPEIAPEEQARIRTQGLIDQQESSVKEAQERSDQARRRKQELRAQLDGPLRELVENVRSFREAEGLSGLTPPPNGDLEAAYAYVTNHRKELASATASASSEQKRLARALHLAEQSVALLERQVPLKQQELEGRMQEQEQRRQAMIARQRELLDKQTALERAQNALESTGALQMLQKHDRREALEAAVADMQQAQTELEAAHEELACAKAAVESARNALDQAEDALATNRRKLETTQDELADAQDARHARAKRHLAATDAPYREITRLRDDLRACDAEMARAAKSLKTRERLVAATRRHLATLTVGEANSD